MSKKEEQVYRKAVRLYEVQRLTAEGQFTVYFTHLSPDQQCLWLIRAREALKQEEAQLEEDRDQADEEETQQASANLQGATPLGQSEARYAIEVIQGCHELVPREFVRQELNGHKMMLMYFGEVSVKDAIAMFVKYYNNLKEKVDMVEARRAHNKDKGG